MNEQCEQQEKERSVLTWLDGRLVIVGHRARVLHTLVVGDLLDLYIAGSWQHARVCSGGVRSLYYETECGQRGRFATSMSARFIASAQKEVCSGEPVTTTLALASDQTSAAAPDSQEIAVSGAGVGALRRPVERVSFLHYSVSRFVAVRFPDPPVGVSLSEQERCA